MSAAASVATAEGRAGEPRLRDWLLDAALPMWASAGFDATRDLFHEQLNFDLTSDNATPRRLMVQARQIALYADAERRGLFPGGELALRAFRQTAANYLHADGAPGWAHSLAADGATHDPRRDLYGHAFALFAIAHVLRLGRNRQANAALAATLAVLDDAFAAGPAEGYWESLPRRERLRRQDPHMHLFEAMLDLFETTGDERHLQRGERLLDLATRRFAPGKSGVLWETFDEQWNGRPHPHAGVVEPGHLFEWALLLRQHARLSRKPRLDLADRWTAFALRHGVEPEIGRVYAELNDDGEVRSRHGRVWPHAEAVRLLEAVPGTSAPMSASIRRRLQKTFCPPELCGGWFDRVDEFDRPLSSVMPASTLYHLYFALT